MDKERKTYKGKETAKIKIKNEKNEKVKQWSVFLNSPWVPPNLAVPFSKYLISFSLWHGKPGRGTLMKARNPQWDGGVKEMAQERKYGQCRSFPNSLIHIYTALW